MGAIIAALHSSLPNAKVIVIGPPPLDEAMWQQTALKLTAKRKVSTQGKAMPSPCRGHTRAHGELLLLATPSLLFPCRESSC